MPWIPSRLTKAQLEERRILAFERLDTGFPPAEIALELDVSRQIVTSGKPFLTRTE